MMFYMKFLAMWGTATVASSQSLATFDYYQERGSHKIDVHTISRGLEHYSMAWYPTDATEDVHCFVFCMGTGAVPEDYFATGEHLASHGFAAIYTPMRPWDVTRGLEYCRDGTIEKEIPALKSLVNATRMGVGGHSGGGPYAVHAASGVDDVNVIITQHAASIPVMNKQSDETMRALKGDLMVLCGTEDSMPFCDCPRVEEDYYDRAPLGRAIVKVPDGHVDGACLEAGEKNEAGYITAMLYYGLRGEADAATAISQGKNDDIVTVDFDHVE